MQGLPGGVTETKTSDFGAFFQGDFLLSDLDAMTAKWRFVRIAAVRLPVQH